MQSSDLLQKSIRYVFNDNSYLQQALTHPSYANEHHIDKCFTNQRLEFLGDAVLELVSSDFLYRKYDSADEGTLTKNRASLVCEETLSNIARELKLYDYLLIGNGEDRNLLKNNNSTMCDTLEAIIGAIYIDGGIENARSFIKSFILCEANLTHMSFDYKTVLQELANKNKYKLIYELVDEYGPDHNKTFVINAHFGDKVLTKGVGKSKKEAEQNAAKAALEIIK